jgi:hypothetical protein
VTRQVSVDARDKDHRVEQFKVITTILDESIGGGRIGDLHERRWEGEVDIRSVKSVMKMGAMANGSCLDYGATVAGRAHPAYSSRCPP